MSSDDRRAPGISRIPFGGLIEVGGELGPSFEAQAVNLSQEGMLLRTAYLPEPGQPLTCRFEAGGGTTVVAAAEVVWAKGSDGFGEFAIRFTDVDAAGVDAIKRLCGVGVVIEGGAAAPAAGSKVRLHIEGLASPMRAKIRETRSAAVTVGSDLGFLQVGRHLELEDAQSGDKRPASIDRVEVAIDPASQVPQLVVTLRYDDAPATAGNTAPTAKPAEETRAPASRGRGRGRGDDLAAVEEASAQMKGAVARSFARIGPAFERLAHRARTTVSLLAQRRTERGEDAIAPPPRRTTAPPPGGGLHAAGKRVVRGELASMADDAPGPGFRMTASRAAVAGGVMIAAVAGAIVLKRVHREPPAPQVAAASAAPAAEAPPSAAPAPAAPLLPAQPTPAQPMPADTAMPAAPAPPSGALAAADETNAATERPEHHRHARVTPFGNGPVHHGNVLRLEMDGAIESIEGAQQPTGFTVKLPGRKSLEPAAPLADRDSRIAAIKVANDQSGAELTVAFKDGVPNYQVNARGDTLVIALAPAGELEKTVAKNDEKGDKSDKGDSDGKSGKAGRHHRHHKRTHAAPPSEPR